MMYSLGSEIVGIDLIFRFSRSQPSEMAKFCVTRANSAFWGHGPSHQSIVLGFMLFIGRCRGSGRFLLAEASG